MSATLFEAIDQAVQVNHLPPASRGNRESLSQGAAANLKVWLTGSQYALYRAEITALVERGEFQRLDSLFWEVIPFGTGGRRGLMGPFGSATINDRTVAESAFGLADYLLKTIGPRAKQPSAAIAYDSRNRSAEFARITACTLAAQGLLVHFFPEHRSTPELSFAVRQLGCDVGVVISASHNPPSDNGFKAYWSTGGQVLSPHDKGIIDCVYAAREIPQVEFHQALAEGKIRLLGKEMDEAYIKALVTLSLSDSRDVGLLFTPLHGVGETSVYEVLRSAGFQNLSILESQRQPDGEFPNVPDHLPNPERFEVFRPAIEQARNQPAIDLILASDPDADRIGVCVRDRNGEFIPISGNRVGALITDYVIRKRKDLTPLHYVVETLVTTPQIGAIARASGLRVVDDLLVGFKYIGQTIDALGPDLFVFGAEESLGYLAGNYARDKDAAIAALYISELAAELKREGKTLLDQLDLLARQHGIFLEDQVSQTCHGPTGKEQINLLMRMIRTNPPGQFGEIQLSEARDYKTHEVRALPGNQKVRELGEPTGDLVFVTGSSGEVTIQIAARPSGTEPKIKFYFFASSPCRGDLGEARQRAQSLLNSAMDGLRSWIRNTLAAETSA